MSTLKTYTRAEVEKTASKNNVLIILHNKIYNVTPFLNEHPGGEEILMDHGGRDGTEDFNDVGHSTDALEMMKTYLVGELAQSERTQSDEKPGWKAGYNSKEPEKYVNGPGVPFALLAGGLIVIVIAILYFFQ